MDKERKYSEYVALNKIQILNNKMPILTFLIVAIVPTPIYLVVIAPTLLICSSSDLI